MTLTIEELQANLPEIIKGLKHDAPVIITQNNRTVATLVGIDLPKGKPVYGRGKGRMQLDMEDKSHMAAFAEFM
jgi:prevent-host-death family protein